MTDTFWNDIYAAFINLPKDLERREFMESQLKKYSIPYHALSATDGRTFDFTGIYDEERALKKHGAPLSAPEKGCAHSHREALRAFLASDKQYGLIMEDDVVLEESFIAALQHVLLHKESWDYVQFNYGPVGWQGVQLWWFLLLRDKSMHSPLRFMFACMKALIANTLSFLWGARDAYYKARKSGRLARLIRDQYLAGCYLLTRDAARVLIELNTPLTYTADRIQNIARRESLTRVRAYVPRIVRQKRESFASSINNEHFGKDIIAA